MPARADIPPESFFNLVPSLGNIFLSFIPVKSLCKSVIYYLALKQKMKKEQTDEIKILAIITVIIALFNAGLILFIQIL